MKLRVLWRASILTSPKALLIVPQATAVKYFSNVFLTPRTINPVTDLLSYYAFKASQPVSDNIDLEILADLCQEFLIQQDVGETSETRFPEHLIVQLLEAAIRHESQSLFELVCSNIEVSMSPQFFTWAVSKLKGSTLPFTRLSSTSVTPCPVVRSILLTVVVSIIPFSP